ncbi:DUF4260 domain-containing protein, partial [Streptomyces sp. XM83C]|nr:DUF4260 domain-containing protein [Streptomyces sp. XM83C]
GEGVDGDAGDAGPPLGVGEEVGDGRAAAEDPRVRRVLTASRSLLLAGLGWTVHIAADRAFGYGTRRADGAIH